MNEAKWLESDRLEALLTHLGEVWRRSVETPTWRSWFGHKRKNPPDRKTRLFACASC